MVNDFFDAVKSRLKAPYFGYAILAFFALNWRSIFMLVMTKGTPQERLEAFDSNTNIWFLYVLPITTGFLVTAATPWLQWLFNWFSHKPLEKTAFLALSAESKQIAEKTRLEQVRSEQLANREKELIDRAERDVAVQNIEDEELKKQLQEEIQALREERDQRSKQEDPVNHLSDAELSLLRAAGRNGIGRIENLGPSLGLQAGDTFFGNENRREFSRYTSSVESLLKKGLIRKLSKLTGLGLFTLTEKGWQTYEALDW